MLLKLILVALPAVVVVEERFHVLELVGDFGRRLSCPVVLELLISVVLVFLCFYQLAPGFSVEPCQSLLSLPLPLIHRTSYATRVALRHSDGLLVGRRA